MISALVSLGVAISAFLAAYYWFRSAAVKLPAPGMYWDEMPETDPWLQATRAAARFNRLGAMWAGVSALLTFISLIATSVDPGGYVVA